MNAPEVPRSNENGLHVRNDASLVILAKKDRQLAVEKF